MPKTYVQNINAVYREATPAEIDAGINWYSNAQSKCNSVARSTAVSLRTVAGVCAALSPSNEWGRNLENTDTMVSAYVNGDDIDSFKVSTYNPMKAKAWSILEAMPETDSAVTSILNGQKIVSFFGNIMGHEGTCTIDGHAYNIAMGERVGLTTSAINIGKKKYADLQHAYHYAARRTWVSGRQLKAYEMQAITWVAWKRIHNI